MDVHAGSLLWTDPIQPSQTVTNGESMCIP